MAHQYNGRLGKEDNCQVGVFSALNCGAHSVLLGARLFLPQVWAQDKERCLKAGIPEEHIISRTKIELARQLMQEAVDRNVEFSCITMDAFYGRDTGLLEWIDEQGLIYCADVPSNTLVFEKEPTSFKRPRPMSQAARGVDQLAGELSQPPGQRLTLGEGEKGSLEARVWRQRVWVWPEGRPEPRECWLIARRQGQEALKVSLSNAPQKTSLKLLAHWQGSRYFVERVFQDAKSHAGMAQYQARGWRAWHHHMALVALALFFMSEQRLLLAQEVPLLSAADIVELLDWHLSRKLSQEQLMAMIQHRHRKRQRNALNTRQRQRDQEKKSRRKKPRKSDEKKLPK